MSEFTDRHVTDVRRMTDAELEQEYWQPKSTAPNPYQLILDDDTRLFPSQDPEGNDFGTFLTIDADTVTDTEGEVIDRIGGLSTDYMDVFGWDDESMSRPSLIVFTDGSGLVPARNHEATAPGALFGRDPDGDAFRLE